MNIKVSIILISKNVVNYIEECLKSLVSQTLNEIEIICIDAFSNDGTRNIIQKYMEKDNRIFLYDDIKGSTGYSNNLGVEKAKGEFVVFVEADDFVTSDMCEIFYKIAVENDVDYVKAGYFTFDDTAVNNRFYRKVQIFHGENLYNRVINPSKTPSLIFADNNIWTGIYKRKFLRKYVNENETSGAAYQDMGFMIKVLMNSTRALYIEKNFYYYRRGRDGASMTNPKGMHLLCKEICLNKEYLSENVNTTKEHWMQYYKKILNSFIIRIVPKAMFFKYITNNGEMVINESIISAYKEFGDIILDGIRKQYITVLSVGMEAMLQANMLARNSEDFIYYNFYKYQTLYDSYNAVINKANECEKIVIFGAGEWGQHLLWTLKNKNIDNVYAYCDNNIKIQHSFIAGKEVLPLSDILNENFNVTYFIANEKHSMAIKEQLLLAGISESDIVEYKMFK